MLRWGSGLDWRNCANRNVDGVFLLREVTGMYIEVFQLWFKKRNAIQLFRHLPLCTKAYVMWEACIVFIPGPDSDLTWPCREVERILNPHIRICQLRQFLFCLHSTKGLPTPKCVLKHYGCARSWRDFPTSWVTKLPPPGTQSTIHIKDIYRA